MYPEHKTYCDTRRRHIATQMKGVLRYKGGVLKEFPFSQGSGAKKHGNKTWRCIAVLFREVAVVAGSDILLNHGLCICFKLKQESNKMNLHKKWGFCPFPEGAPRCAQQKRKVRFCTPFGAFPDVGGCAFCRTFMFFFRSGLCGSNWNTHLEDPNLLKYGGSNSFACSCWQPLCYGGVLKVEFVLLSRTCWENREPSGPNWPMYTPRRNYYINNSLRVIWCNGRDLIT